MNDSDMPISDLGLEVDWDRYCHAVRGRLERGRDQYGDRSFQRSPQELMSEIEAELLDLTGWGFILWRRLRDLADRLPQV